MCRSNTEETNKFCNITAPFSSAGTERRTKLWLVQSSDKRQSGQVFGGGTTTQRLPPAGPNWISRGKNSPQDRKTRTGVSVLQSKYAACSNII